MKHLLSLLLAVLLVTGCALAEIDNAMLENAPDMAVFVDDTGVNLVIRPMDQPYIGMTDDPGADACAYLDLIELPNEHMTLPRLILCVAGDEMVNARELRVSVGDRTYVFDVSFARTVSEYDMEYYEDYAVCLTDESLPLLKALGKSKNGSATMTLTGDRTVKVTVEFSVSEAAALYDLFIRAGGENQALETMRSLWPVTVVK